MGKKQISGFSMREENRLRENLTLVDLVIEVLDARLPVSSRNPRLRKMLGPKKRIIVLNKTDLAEQEITGCWLRLLAGEWPVLAFNAKRKADIIRMERLIETLRPRSTKYKRPFRIMVVGIPNVGKSTIINRLVQKSAAKTGNTPGITRGPQWIKLRAGWDLLDTPGFLSPFLRNEQSILLLGAIGSLAPGTFDAERAAGWLVEQFLAREKTTRILLDLYSVRPEVNNCTEIISLIGKARGCFSKGAEVDIFKTSQLILSDFRRGVLGPITLERPLQ